MEVRRGCVRGGGVGGGQVEGGNKTLSRISSKNNHFRIEVDIRGTFC